LDQTLARLNRYEIGCCGTFYFSLYCS